MTSQPTKPGFKRCSKVSGCTVRGSRATLTVSKMLLLSLKITSTSSSERPFVSGKKK